MTEIKKKSIMASVVVIFMITVGILGAYITLPSGEDGKFGTLTVSAAEANPGAGASGILEVFIVDHSQAPSYTSNLTEGAAYDLGHGVDSFSIEIPHSTAFDIVVKCRANTTHAYDSAWNLSLIRCNLTATGDLSIGPLEGMTEYQIGSNSTYIWVNYVLDNGGSGYTIGRDDSVTISAIKFEYYG